MIIDSHCHYCHRYFDNAFLYLAHERKRSRNNSLILPQVIQKIAELKGIGEDEVERVTAENALRLFRLPI